MQKLMFDVSDSSGALFSNCDIYRYRLWRRWDWSSEPKQICFLALNPSTADHTKNDPTVRRCISFAKDWGFNSMFMMNIFAYRSTDPKGLRQIADPIGPDNNAHLLIVCSQVSKVICCWGNHGTYRNRDVEVRKLLANIPVYHLGLTGIGQPKHPLYLKSDTQPVLW